MNLQEMKKWAQEIDPMDVKESKRQHVKCYQKMIIEKIGMIDSMSIKMESYMNKIGEYLDQLEKVGICKNPKKVTIGQEKEEERLSPLIP